LWFSLIGSKVPTLIEAKIIDTDGGALIMQSQLKAWRSIGTGSNKPNIGFHQIVCSTNFTFGLMGSFCIALIIQKLSLKLSRCTRQLVN
jgi:hypothetical protein